MKRCLFLFLCIVVMQKSFAQITFCPPGAKWTYLFTDVYPYLGATTNMPIEYVKDSVVDGTQIKILWSIRFFMERDNYWAHGYTWIKQSGDTIFMRNKITANQWQILYNFAAPPGQSWTNVLENGAVNYTTTVDSVGNALIGSVNHKVLFVSYYKNDHFQRQGFITERLGGDMYLFNYEGYHSTHIEEILEILCYKDDLIGELKFTEKDCNYSNPAGLGEQGENLYFRIFPNPVNDIINFESNLNDVEIIILDLNGRILKQELIINQKVNTPDLIPGIYFLQIKQNKELVYKTKIVKE